MLFIQQAVQGIVNHLPGSEFFTHGVVEVLTGLLWAGLTIAIQQIFKWFKARSIEKKFPVGGTYLAHYIDKGVKHTELLSFQQRGHKLRGKNIIDTERNVNLPVWDFDAEIMQQGYIQGGYVSQSPFDKGFGAYFLQFVRNGDLMGYWLGKDTEEPNIIFGEYRLLKRPLFSISQVENSDITSVLDIAEKQLGDAYIDSASLKVSDKSVALCARVSGAVVGFATAQITSTTDFVKKIEDRVGSNSHLLKQLVRRLEGEQQIGFVASAAVKSDYAGRGIGADLIGSCIKRLEDLGANVLVATAWRSKNGAQAGSILECRGFRCLFEIEKYWEKDSVAHGYSCPTCGPPPCQCSAILYIRNRHGARS